MLLGGSHGSIEIYDESFRKLTKKNISTESIVTIWQTNQRKGGNKLFHKKISSTILEKFEIIQLS